jgi:AcrR family transcriptional regulator
VTDPPGTRERILEATIGALVTGTESAFTIDQIADSAKVGKQSIYHYFGDRDGLVVAAQAERYRRGIQTGLNALTESVFECVTEDEYAHLLVNAAIAVITSGTERRQFRMQALGSAIARQDLQTKIGEAHRASVAVLAKILAFGQRRQWVLTTYSATTLSALWFDMVTGHHVFETYGVEEDREAVSRATVDAIILMLFGRTFPETSSSTAFAQASEDAARAMTTPAEPQPPNAEKT